MKRRVLGKTTLFHALFTKKKNLNKIFSSVPPPALSQKDADNPLACHVVEEWRGRTPWAVRGGSTMATLATSPSPIFAYKNRGRGKPKKGECTQGEEKKNKLRERQQEKRENTKEGRGKSREGRGDRKRNKTERERRRIEEKKAEE